MRRAIEYDVICDHCGESDTHCALYECDICHADVCKHCSHAARHDRVCDACSLNERECYDCGSEVSERCQSGEKECFVLLCTKCAKVTADGTILCWEHSAQCASCEEWIALEKMMSCQHSRCDNGSLMCDPCSDTVEGHRACDKHIVGTCTWCTGRFYKRSSYMGCYNCMTCQPCARAGDATTPCETCGFSSICAICEGTCVEGEACGECMASLARGFLMGYETSDKDFMVRRNSFAWHHKYLGAHDPEIYDPKIHDAACLVPPLPLTPGPDQRVLAPLDDLSVTLTAWGDITTPVVL